MGPHPCLGETVGLGKQIILRGNRQNLVMQIGPRIHITSYNKFPKPEKKKGKILVMCKSKGDEKNQISRQCCWGKCLFVNILNCQKPRGRGGGALTEKKTAKDLSWVVGGCEGWCWKAPN